MESKAKPRGLYPGFTEDSRYVGPRGQQIEDVSFISDASLFRWFAQLNLRLAQDSVVILSRQEFVNELNDLSDQATWASPPQEILDFGSRYGLVSTANSDDQYIFPLAWVLSRVSSTVLSEVAESLQAFEDSDIRLRLLTPSIAEAVEGGLANFPENEVTVVRGRENLSGGGRLILQELGRCLNLTRERVRQIESHFWRKLLGFSSSKKRTTRREWTIRSAELRRAFINGFLSDFMRGHGCLLVVGTTIDANLRLFSAKCIGLPVAYVPQTHNKVIGAFPSELAALENIYGNTENHMNEDSAVSSLERSLPLVKSDLNKLVADARRVWINHARKMEKVSLVLRTIGRPAHYSEIATSYKSMFPEDQTKERNIHVILTRQRCGVVSTGQRGIYALNGWR